MAVAAGLLFIQGISEVLKLVLHKEAKNDFA
jgi:hypothetical protein